MANMEKFIFSVDAQTDKAVHKLQEINRLMNEIERVRNRGLNDYSTTNQKDMDLNMRSMSKLTSMYKEVSRDLDEIQRKMREIADTSVIPEGATGDQVKEIERLQRTSEKQAQAAIRQQRLLQQEYKRTLMSFQELAHFQQNQSRNFKHVFSSNDLYNLPRDRKEDGSLDSTRARKIIDAISDSADGVASELENVRDKIREVNKLDRRSESLSRRASASNYMSYQQFENFRSDLNTSRSSYADERERNRNALAELGMERSRLTQEIKDIERNPQNTPEDIDRKIALQQTVRAIDDEFESRLQLNKTLDRTIENMEKYNKTLERQNVEVKPERGTMRGMMYERAPAIGLALGGAVAGVFGGLYARGSSVNRSMRDDIISIGQRTDQEDWRTNVRDNAFEAGLADRLGFTGQQMLSFQTAYLSNRGFQDTDDLNTAMQSQAVFSRVTGTSADRTQDFFNNLFNSAALVGNDVADIQNAFVGAIKQSGMEGREEQQLAALEGLLAEASRGRVLGQTDVLNYMGIQSILSRSGNPALQGTRGGELMQSLDQSIRQGFDDPSTRLLFGMGSQFQGIEGRWELRKQMERGISDPTNVQRLFDIANSYGGTGLERREVFLTNAQRMGADLTTEQVDALYDLYEQGQLTEDGIARALQGALEEGSDLSQERLDRYQSSHAATDNQSEAVLEKQAAQLNDLGNVVRKANAAMGGVPPVAYATIASLVALSAAALGTAGSFGLGTLLRRGVAGSYNRGGGTGSFGRGTGTFGGGMGGFGGWLGGGFGRQQQRTPTSTGRGGGMAGMGHTTIQGMSDPNVRKGGLPNTGPQRGGGGWFRNMFGGAGPRNGIVAGGSMLGGLANRALLPLGIISAISAVASAPEGAKGETFGTAFGGLGGGLGGAALGASIGSVFPGVGTIIGGLIGGFLGSGVGSSAGGWLGSQFGTKTASASDVNTSDLKEQVDRENTTRKDLAENKRSDNISEERRNLDRYENSLKEADRLLRQARLQNGIFGSGGMGGGGGTGIGSTGGNLRFLPDGQKWTDNNIVHHDLGYTDAALSAQDLDRWIDSMAPSNSIMRGMGEAFFRAGTESGLDPRYLVAHAALETGWGTSNIAKQKGNMYGIGAFDASPFSSAYSFNNVEAGIVEGAKWIAENYYGRGQTTLHTMRHNGGKHEYATDPQWDKKIANLMKGAPSGTGSVNINSKVEVNVNSDQPLSSQVANDQELKRTGLAINERIFGSMNYYARDMRRF
ncbi:tail associated lysin [Bacillus phage Shbh1]|uniref:Tapemeasure-like protein n=1 Tax=Bacillus phage Shbh1 TaxID=1796992 RepID=A0A142F1E8_9CAUD|nr:tail associated lysin [Bacillus phage Shbh1]AMQ66605.1 tapemeasure-like protein [Bacillus phage Shbh1]